MRLNRGTARLTLMRGGASAKSETSGAGRSTPVTPAPRLRLVGATPRQLSPGAHTLLGWLNGDAYRLPFAEVPDHGLDLLRIDAAARLAHDARNAAARRARGGEAS
ncbi:MAG TPA: hypothetical protein VF761_18995 [Gemmatimonadaceae bacterium]